MPWLRAAELAVPSTSGPHRMPRSRAGLWKHARAVYRIQRAHDALNASEGRYSADHERTAQHWIGEVCQMLRPDAELSTVARACVMKSGLAGRPGDRIHPPAQVASPPAGRPYDMRRAAVSPWLNAGVPAPTVARRVGHLVEVLLAESGCR
jgi:hypothetical protein